ncbi:hypothetical protein CISG_03126 [Coccidioides immitis RMSCC 3703]|uniref:DNA polymerase V n=1 Tax=Coccidioides immitis RMSCC 3703 TaxID=454286 RepID=A0A0J8QJU6_COCIT|nr:hypothetical protein CISG_03126 [Coccidioides immitis RMSCC 3703]
MAGAVNPRKRRREPVNVDVKLVEIYEDLSNEQNEIRLKAAHDLLSRFTPDQNAPNEQIEKSSVASVSGSNVEFGGADIPKTIEILESQTSPVNCASGQEERDHYFGRLFGAEAILKSAILLQPDVPFENWSKLLFLIFELAKKKPWLREECGYIIYCAVRDIASKKAGIQYVDAIIKGLAENGLARTPEGVAIWLAVMESSLPVNFASGVWQNNNPLHSKERSSLAKIMKESSDLHAEQNGENGTANRSGVWNPKLHFAWDPILAKLYTFSQGKKGDKSSKQISFPDFWTEVVDNGLFAAASSEERKYWGFLVSMKVINDGPKEAAGSVYNGDADAVSMLDELKICYDKFVSRKKADDADTAEASDILVVILLSFASKQSQLFRRTSEQVFGAFADRVTATGLQSLIAILEAKDTLAGQQEMFENDDEGSDVEMIDPDDDDVEEIDQSGEESEEDLEASDEESDEDGSENEDGDELEEFDAKLAAALGTHRADKDLDACSEKSSDSDMDDDQMEALDEQLAQVFKARSQVTSKKKEKKEARENMINFKNRALDLLEIYVKKSHSSIIATDILLPLLQAVRKSKVQQIANKASNVLREYCKLCKGNSLPAVEDEDRLWDLLKAIHEEATHSGPAFHATACSQASLLIVRILVAQKKENAKGIVDVYAETRKRQLLSKRCHVQPSFFSDWNNWCVSASKQMKE